MRYADVEQEAKFLEKVGFMVSTIKTSSKLLIAPKIGLRVDYPALRLGMTLTYEELKELKESTPTPLLFKTMDVIRKYGVQVNSEITTIVGQIEDQMKGKE